MHFIGSNKFSHVIGVKIYQFKAKNSKTKPYHLCVCNVSKDLAVDSMTKTGVNRYVYDFSVDYDTIDVSVVVIIPKYLRK